MLDDNAAKQRYEDDKEDVTTMKGDSSTTNFEYT